MKQEFRTEPGAQLTRNWLDELTLPLTKSRFGFNFWGRADLHMSLHGLSPGLSLNSGKDTRQMAKHRPHQSFHGSQLTFFFFLQLHPFLQDVLITWNPQVLTPQDPVQKASPLWIPSSLLTLSTPCLILFFFTHLSLSSLQASCQMSFGISWAQHSTSAA